MAKKEYLTTLLKIENVADDTYAVWLKKPAHFTFVAGQYTELHLTKDMPLDPKGSFREFSISSAPHEKDLMFVFRKGESIFKNEFLQLQPGSRVKITEPVGEFVLPEKPEREIIFLVGGIGMTAIRPMIMDLVHKKSSLKTTIFYSNSTVERIAFFDELSGLPQKQHKVIFTVTGEVSANNAWKGETSRITAELLKKYEPNFREKQFYLVGPARFVTAMVALTRSEKIPFSQVKLESFGLYGKNI